MLSLNALLFLSHRERHGICFKTGCVCDAVSLCHSRQASLWKSRTHRTSRIWDAVETCTAAAPLLHQKLLTLFLAVSICYHTGAMWVSSGCIHTPYLRFTYVQRFVQNDTDCQMHVATSDNLHLKRRWIEGWIECHVSFEHILSVLWPLFRTCWNQHARVCYLFGKWTVEAPSFWSGKDQLRACSSSRSSHPSSGSDVTFAR